MSSHIIPRWCKIPHCAGYIPHRNSFNITDKPEPMLNPWPFDSFSSEKSLFNSEGSAIFQSQEHSGFLLKPHSGFQEVPWIRIDWIFLERTVGPLNAESGNCGLFPRKFLCSLNFEKLRNKGYGIIGMEIRSSEMFWMIQGWFIVVNFKEKGSSKLKWFLTGLSCLSRNSLFGVKAGLNWNACRIPPISFIVASTYTASRMSSGKDDQCNQF